MFRVGIVVVVLSALGVHDAGAAPTRPPPAPAIAPGARTFVAFGGAPAVVRLAWAAGHNVARYRARWTDAGAHVDVELPGTATAFEREERTPGLHQLSVVAIDADGRESPPVEIAVEVVTVTAYAPGSREPTLPTYTSASDDDDDDEIDDKHEPNAFAVGARFTSPGLTCQLNDGPRGAEVVASSAGAFTLHCGGEAGQPRVDVALVIAPVLVHTEARALVAGRTTRVHVTLASVAAIGSEIEIEAFGDLELGEPERTSGGLDVPVTARATGGLILRAGAFELGRVALPVVAAAAGAVRAGGTAEPGSAWAAFDVGGHVGIFVPPTIGLGANAIGVPRRPDDVVGTAPLAALHVGWFPTRRAGLEAELGLGTPGYVNAEGISAIVVGRVQLAARIVEDRRYGLRVLAGADVIATLTERSTSRRDATGGVHAGLAFSVETRSRLWLRVQALDVIVPARDGGYAHCAEVSVGVVTRLGRQDRW